MTRHLAAVAFAVLCTFGLAHAHGDEHAKHTTAAKPVQTPYGIAGNPAKITRTVSIDMTDQMRFIPSSLAVKRGDTVRFVLANKGATMHEMVIGTRKDLAQHAAMMRKMPDMQHDAPWMAHVKPGATGEIVWQFNRAGTFDFACLIPGHFEAGMIGSVTVK